MRFTTLIRLLAMAAVLALLVPSVMLAQSTLSGAISGTVTDQSGAVLPDVTVTLKSVSKGFTQTAKTNAQGAYQFPLLEPGAYSITISAPNFKTLTATTTVSVEQNSIVNAKLEVGAAGTTVEVSGEAPLLQSETSEISTTFNEREIAEVPNGGNDMSFIAQTSPGAVMNTGGGYGNFSIFGMSASSNLFTLNGMYDNDPFLNLNNSGATNLLLGQNEVAEATVVTNGYSGQYGGFIGANINYITKSGSNNWHGNANYFWNGRAMNANDYFHTNFADPANDEPRGFVNANQYAASFGGPIWKNKAFFFWNYEGLRVIIPVSNNQLHGPTQDFEQAINDNLTAIGLPESIPFYNQMYGFWNNAKGYSTATPGYSGGDALGDPTGCGGLTYTDNTSAVLPYGTTFGNVTGGLPCVQTFNNVVGNFTHEYLTSGRFDFNVTNNDKVFVRLQEDIGTQATATDALNPIFDSTSYQPEYQGQISWNRPIGTKSVNSLLFAAQYYRAIFGPSSLSNTLAAFPTTVELNDNSLTTVGGEDFVWPQGRNVTGYQIVDDYSYNLSTKHTLKAGLYFHRNLISDHDYGLFTSGLAIPLSLDDFYYGGVGSGASDGGYTVLLQNFASSLDQPIKLYQLGWYVQDEWKARSDLKLTFALRMDHNSVPNCGTSCFARFSGPFADVADSTGGTAYNQSIVTGLSSAFTGFTKVAVQPRFGFSWSPSALKNTVFRGGIGIFMDTFPGQIADALSGNVPLLNPFTTYGANLSPQENETSLYQSPVFSTPTQPYYASSNNFTAASNSNTALVQGFPNGATLASLQQQTNGFFTPPNFSNPGHIVAPTTTEWNFEIQKGIGNSTVFTINYVGNHGIHETALFNGVNGFCPTSLCPNGWVGLPAAAPDPRFTTVTEYNTVGVSNYNGLNLTVQHRFSRGLQGQLNYTWGHAIDEVSNGGFNPFYDPSTGAGTSILNPADDQNLREFNYGNADYDTRHSITANYVYEIPKGPTEFLKGWQLSGTVFWRTGFPYTVTNSGVTGELSPLGFGGPAFANYSGPSSHPTCSGPGPGGSQDVGPVACIPVGDFPDVGNAQNQLVTGTMNQTRNQFVGPRYFDTDMTIMKYTRIPHWETAKVGIGAQFFNLFNHPNFQPPINDINNGTFGDVLGTVNPPTSILGSFLGGDASTRLIQLTAKFNF
ncbi:MAG TPA: TonB-dependent receptor [Terriglobales bacterium]|nr:TonB-dependent receptor [Terriglobales bacterium]